MKCDLCGGMFSVPATYIRMENAADRDLNRKMAVCGRCAYAILQKALAIHNANGKADA